MATAGKQRAVTLTKPFSLDAEAEQDYRPPHLLQRLLSLFKNVSPGADLARFQVPAVFNYPKSQLQCYGESVYCTASDMVSRCNRGESPLERLVCVVAWAISTTRPPVFGSAPFNPTLGETHHVSNSHLNLLMEQGVGPTESAHVRSDVSQAILNNEWERAREAKKKVEERQREIQKEREAKGENWTPKHFRVSHTKEGGWDCSPIHQWVPPATTIVL